MAKWVLIVALFILFQTGQAQKQQLTFDHYGLESGFHSREAMDIVTTPDGMVWISSNDGLVRYDSKNFKFYQHRPGDSNSLTHNYCLSMQVDKRGWIWIVSDDNLDVFDPARESFRHIKLFTAKHEARPVYPLSFYYDNARDIMWIATAHGLYFSKSGELNLQHFITGASITDSTAIGSVLKCGGDLLWLACGFNIIKINTATRTVVEKYALPEKIDNIINNSSANSIQCAFMTDSLLYLGTWMTGLIEFNTVTKKFNQYCYSDYTRSQNTVYDIAATALPGQENILWVSTGGGGLKAFDKVTKSFTSYNSIQYKDPFGIKGTTYGLYNVKQDALWIGSASGLHRYDYKKQFFKKIDLEKISNGVDLFPVVSMAVEKNNSGKDKKLWLYIPYKEGYIYDLTANSIEPLPSEIRQYVNPPNNFFDFFIDSENVLWISTKENGLMGYDIVSKRIIRKGQEYFFSPKQWVNCFFEDTEKQIWLGTYNGVFLMNRNRTAITEVTTINNELRKRNTALGITGFTEDNKGHIWFAADHSDKPNSAIGFFNKAEDKVAVVYDENVSGNRFNPSLTISGILYNNNRIYFADYSNGIAWFDINTNKAEFNYLDNKQGLNNSYVGQLIADNENNIWCSTAFGISRYKVFDNSFNNFSYYSYALGNTHNPFIYFSSQSNRLYIGQSNSVNYFSPSSIPASRDMTIFFTGLTLFGQPYYYNNRTPVDGDQIVLRNDQNSVAVEFALLSYSNSFENRYSWRLAGLENNWQVSNDNIASYANLGPGKYTLYVKAANSNGVWSKEIKLVFIIKPPFYNTWWFYLSCLVLCASIVYWFFQLKINRIKEKNKLRNKIASDLHDEIGSTLTSINILSTVSQQAMTEQPQQAKEMLEQISLQSKTIQQNMSDIVWSIRSENEKTENLLIRMREYAAQTLEPLNINTTIDTDENPAAKTLPMEYRKDLLLIYKEAINNVAKHANATRVKIHFSIRKNNIFLSIQDNGTWKGSNTGTGTKTMKERAKNLHGKITIDPTMAGTRVEIVIPVP